MLEVTVAMPGCDDGEINVAMLPCRGGHPMRIIAIRMTTVDRQRGGRVKQPVSLGNPIKFGWCDTTSEWLPGCEFILCPWLYPYWIESHVEFAPPAMRVLANLTFR